LEELNEFWILKKRLFRNSEFTFKTLKLLLLNSFNEKGMKKKNDVFLKEKYLPNLKIL